MKKKVLSLLLSASMLAVYCNFNIVSAKDAVAVTGTTLSSGYNKPTIIDLGRAYPLEYITTSSSNCTVMASNDREFGSTAESTENVALGKKIRSERYTGGGYLSHVATKANDGDTSTAFICTPPNMTDEDSLTIDLEGNYKIEYITVDNNKRDREVYASTTEDFSNPVQISESSSGRYDLNDGNYYRYVRVDFKAANSAENNHFYVYEIGVYANPIGDSPLSIATLTKSGDNYYLNDADKGKCYRYISAKSSNRFTVPKITAYVKAGGFDVLSEAEPQTDSNPGIAYRITDNDLKSKWYGSSVILDMGYCREIEEILVLGSGNAKISVYGDTEGTVMSTNAMLSKNEYLWFGCNDKARYLKIEAVDSSVDIYDVKAYSPNDDSIHIEKETYTDGEWYVADFGKVRLIKDILPCDAVCYVSDNPDFTDASQLSGHLDTLVSGRYIRTTSPVDKLGILTYELPKINLDSGVVTYDTQVYNVDDNQGNVVAKYSSDGRMIAADVSNSANGTIQTENVFFDNSKFMVWDGFDTMKPLLPVSEIEKIKTTPAAEFYVSKSGSDENDGSESMPFATIERAQKAVRAMPSNTEGDIIVHIGSGVYNISDTIEFTEADGGKNGYKVIYKGDGIDRTSISGGVQVANFTQTADGWWEAYLPDISEAYALTVNGTAAKIAQTETPIIPSRAYADGNGYTYNGFVFNESDLPTLTNPEDAYIHTTRSWIDVFIRATSMRKESDGVYLELYPIYFNSAMDSIKMSTLPITAGDKYTIENALEFLDTEGEFYFNKKTHMLYYKPRSDESISDYYAEVPVVEDLVKISGSGIDNHIENLVIDGIKFENSTDPNRYRFGMITDQAQLVRAGMYDRKKVPATIQIDYATNVSIQNCEITNVEKGAISMEEGAVNCKIVNNKIHNIGDGAVVIGGSWHNYIETHSAAPSEKQYDCAMGKPVWVSSGSPGNLVANKASDILSEYCRYYWVSGDPDIINGENPWYAIDLLKPYTISKIELSFPSSQKNYEVLVSNDPDFNEYKMLETVTSLHKSYTVTGDENNKYRYVKIRKTELAQFRINGVFVRTPDVPYQNNVEELSISNVIDNNYIMNTGLKHKAAPAITLFYTIGTEVTNNSIINSNYTAISCGWGWEFNTASTTNKNIHIANNHIKNFNMTAADGGGVYIMGNQPGTVVEGNYIEQPQLPYQENYTNVGIYGESGLRFSIFRNNVIEIQERNLAPSNYAISYFQTNIEDCEMYDNYGTYTNVYDGSGTGCRVERLQKYDSSSKPDNVNAIINNSGSNVE